MARRSPDFFVPETDFDPSDELTDKEKAIIAMAESNPIGETARKKMADKDGVLVKLKGTRREKTGSHVVHLGKEDNENPKSPLIPAACFWNGEARVTEQQRALLAQYKMIEE